MAASDFVSPFEEKEEESSNTVLVYDSFAPPDLDLAENLEGDEDTPPERSHALSHYVKWKINCLRGQNVHIHKFMVEKFPTLSLAMAECWESTDNIDIAYKEWGCIAWEVVQKSHPEVDLADIIDGVIDMAVEFEPEHQVFFPCCNESNDLPTFYDEVMDTRIMLHSYDFSPFPRHGIIPRKQHRYCHGLFRFVENKNIRYICYYLNLQYPRLFQRMLSHIQSMYNDSGENTEDDESSDEDLHGESLIKALNKASSKKGDMKQILYEAIAAAYQCADGILDWPCCKRFFASNDN